MASWRQRKPPESIAVQWIRAIHLLHDSSISDTGDRRFRFYFVVMYYFHPRRLAKSSIAKQNTSHRANVICDGSPSRIRRVRRISFGMTILPRSSIRRTIPVAFIYFFLHSVRSQYHIAIVCKQWGFMRILQVEENCRAAKKAHRSLLIHDKKYQRYSLGLSTSSIVSFADSCSRARSLWGSQCYRQWK